MPVIVRRVSPMREETASGEFIRWAGRLGASERRYAVDCYVEYRIAAAEGRFMQSPPERRCDTESSPPKPRDLTSGHAAWIRQTVSDFAVDYCVREVNDRSDACGELATASV